MKNLIRLFAVLNFLVLGANESVFSEEIWDQFECSSEWDKNDFDEQSEDSNLILDEPIVGYNYNPHVNREVWDNLRQYFLPELHPIKAQLDKIFNKKTRVLENIHSVAKEGFKHPKIRSLSTQIIVTYHKKLPGYILKFYIDTQRPHLGKPEWVYLVARINGVNAIQNYINKNNLNHLFKTPKKWLYPVPHEATTSGKYRKNFILIAEEMDILSDDKNEARWKSSVINEQMLNHFYGIVQGVGLWDCCKPANAPFTKDGRITFIDTELYHNWPVDLTQMIKYISPQMQEYWWHLIRDPK